MSKMTVKRRIMLLICYNQLKMSHLRMIIN